MSEPKNYDVIVIGTSQGGRFLPIAFAKAGRKVAVIERGPLGGVCVNVGCTPTKTMVASARIAYLAKRGAEYGVRTGPVSVDLHAVRKRKQNMVEGARNYFESLVKPVAGMDLLRGEARFTASKTLEVSLKDGETREITAPLIFINTGARPKQLTIKGVESVSLLDSTTIMELDALPEHLLIIGGGYIGLEFGQMFRRFGSTVTVVQHGKQLLAREDPDVAEEVHKVLQEDGIDVLLQTEATRVQAGARGVVLQLRGPAGDRTVAGSHLLVAAGRTPNSDRLNLAAAGVQVDARGFIRVNDRLETNVAGIYALGDVKG